jgi:hypothetical protein
VKPEKYNLKKAWLALQEARRGNGISQHIYDRFAEANAMPLHDEVECQEIQTYYQFQAYHTKVWLMD